MGLFCICEDPNDPIKCVDSAMSNLRLFKEYPDADYLLGFALSQIEDARKCIGTKK